MGFKVRMGECPVRFCPQGHDTLITGRYNTNCKVCSIARATKGRFLNNRYVEAAKNRPCMDCQGWFESYQMDFDHRPGEIKVFQVSCGVGQSLVSVIAEIRKCDVVCSNCHRMRTYKRRQNGPKQ